MDMVQDLQDFFSFEDFSHLALFEKAEFPWDALFLLEKYLVSLQLGKIEGKVAEGAFLENPSLITIGKGTIVEQGAYIRGPCFIGENCVIRHGAYIRGNVLAEKGSVIGHATEVKNSILFQEAHAAHFAYVGDCIVGKKANLGAGVKCANFRLDGKEISTFWQGRTLGSKRNKLGAIIGDGVQIGCNTVVAPGTCIGKETFIYPSLYVKGNVPSSSIVRSKVANVIVKR